jgi:hypothetical protein
MTRFQFSLFGNYFLLHVGRPLWREDRSAICSAMTRCLESLKTHNHICVLLVHLRPLNQEGQVPVFISPRHRVAQLYPGHWAPLRLTGLWRSILTRLHTGFDGVGKLVEYRQLRANLHKHGGRAAVVTHCKVHRILRLESVLCPDILNVPTNSDSDPTWMCRQQLNRSESRNQPLFSQIIFHNADRCEEITLPLSLTPRSPQPRMSNEITSR